MVKIGVMKIDGKKWDDIENAIVKITQEMGKEKVDRNEDNSEWYENNGKLASNGPILGKIIVVTYHTRKKIESIDDLTEQIYPYYTNTSRELAFLEPKGDSEEIWFAFQEGTSEAIKQIGNYLDLTVTMRKRISFNQDFIEFLNTTSPGDKGYVQVFQSDMESSRRKAKKSGHIVTESYMDINTRELKIKENFTEEAGVFISPPSHLSSSLQTIEASISRVDWINIHTPSVNAGPSIFYSSLLYSYIRLSQAFNTFLSL